MYASGATFIPSVARHSDDKDKDSLDAAYVGGTGGAFPIRKTNGVTAVDIIPRTSIDCRELPTNGLKSWPSAPPKGFEIAINMVAVVRPSRPNHVSEYFGPMTW